MMLSAKPSGYSAFSPEVGLHDADFFLDVQSVGAAAVASWLLTEAALRLRFERPSFCVFSSLVAITRFQGPRAVVTVVRFVCLLLLWQDAFPSG